MFRQRLFALAASAALHGLLVWALSNVEHPDGGSSVPLSYAPVTLLDRPVPQPRRDTNFETKVSDAADTASSPAPNPEPAHEATTSQPGRPELPAVPPEEVSGSPASSSGKLALRGLRRSDEPSSTATFELGDRWRPEGALRRSTGGSSDYAPGMRSRGTKARAVTTDRAAQSLVALGFRPRADGSLVYDGDSASEPFKAIVRPDGRMVFENEFGKVEGLVQTERGLALSGRMAGPTEAASVTAGEELWIKQKKALLEQTFELRAKMAVAYAKAQIARQLKTLELELYDIRQSARSPAAQRELLFEHWDACDEDTQGLIPAKDEAGDVFARLDPIRIEAASRARDIIERFIARNYPSGTRDAYTVAELERFNARRKSRRVFRPYAS